MKFGIRFIEKVGSVPDIVRYSQQAEQAGLEYVWYPHDIFMKNTWVVTAAVAQATDRIKIGSVGPNPYTTSPAEIASYLATLDELSAGRAVIGLGLHTYDMVGWAGVDCTDILQVTRESVQMIRQLLRGEIVDHHTAHFNWSDQCYLRFKPVRPDVPLYVCAFGDDFLALSGEVGDGSLPMITPPASAGRMVDCIQKGLIHNKSCKEFDIAGCAWLSVSEDGQEAEAVMRSMIAYFGPYLEDDALATIGLRSADFDHIRDLIARQDYEQAQRAVTDDMLKLGLTGRPYDIIEQIEELSDAGITQINLGGPIGPNVKNAIELLGKKILPRFSATPS
ncbi:MAG TPA: LLM class flavin-dependent oxidoreductase [Sphingomonadales bacterium]|nr:LLM class flavin-dependent oxidoreductase [Sphingomonadales bacterium]